MTPQSRPGPLPKSDIDVPRFRHIALKQSNMIVTERISRSGLRLMCDRVASLDA